MIVVCGEALVDLVAEPESGAGAGAGTPHRWRALPGGGPANTAVALARLGTPVALLAGVGTDAFGDRISAHLAASGVDGSLLGTLPRPTTLAVAGIGPDGAAGYTFYIEGTAAFDFFLDDGIPPALPPATSALHAGSLALALPPGDLAVERLIRRSGGTMAVSVDVNARPGLFGDPDRYCDRLERLLPLIDLVRVSAEDLAWMYPGAPVRDAAGRLLAAGADLVVGTLGADGALAVRSDLELTVPAPAVAVVDTMGAGDAFTAGLLDALHRGGRLAAGRLGAVPGDELRAALAAAARVAALTCTRPGADPPWRHELDATVGADHGTAPAW